LGLIEAAAGMFKSRIKIVAWLLAFCFLIVAGRLWLLQVMRHERYVLLAARAQSMEKIASSKRGAIRDRYGNDLAYDTPYHDISVRVDRLRLKRVTFEQVGKVRELFKQKIQQAASEQAKEQLNKDLDAELQDFAAQLEDDPFVTGLSKTLNRPAGELAGALLKALDSVALKWTSPGTPLCIASGVDEQIWLALRSVNEDSFRNDAATESSENERLFPGLVCTISTRRVYPQGKLCGHVLGYTSVLGPEEEDALRNDGVLLDNVVARGKYWSQLREGLSDEQAGRLETILRVNPRELGTLLQLQQALGRLRPADAQAVAELGLADPVRWFARPARMTLTDTEEFLLGNTHNGARVLLPDRIVGEQGIERAYNNALRGKWGLKLMGAGGKDDSDDAKLFQKNTQPAEGDAIALTISSTWQRAVEKALKGQDRPGAVVVIDVKTGEILALASFPDYDPNLFVPPRAGKDCQEQIKALLGDPAKPLMNRAISEQYPLGSVMKSLIFAVGLEKKLVSPQDTFQCPGYIEFGGQKFHCDAGRAHGVVNVYKALRCSCNVTSQHVGAMIGVENLAPYAKMIFGRRMGLDIPGEVSGIFPDKEWRQKAYPNDAAARVWTKGNDYHLAIGQGQFCCTVLQAAVLMAAVSNGGYVVTPRLWLDGPQAEPRWLGISAANLNIVREGLDEVVNVGSPGERGTAYAPFHQHGPDLAVRVAGKTSTAEHKTGAKAHAWFAGYAPANNPRIAFAVFLEEAGHGGEAAAPIAYQFLKDVYGTRAAPVKNPGSPPDDDPAQ
jgi:cell division protein FtsI/penicillin-binding protein 2